MTKNRNRSFAKRKKEQERQERAAEKRTRRASRGQDGGGSSEDTSRADKPTDEEVARAVERAMNPGNKGARHQRTEGQRLFVGNLDYATTEDELREAFAGAGFNVAEARLVTDRLTGAPRGFAFVDLAEPADAARAVRALHGILLHGRELRVNSAEAGGRN